jgi:hypothetical protein
MRMQSKEKRGKMKGREMRKRKVAAGADGLQMKSKAAGGANGLHL